MTNAFLPPKYQDEKPKTGNSDYLNKWEEGDNKIRIMSNPIFGWEYWTEDDGQRKPVRLDTIEPPEKVPDEAIQDKYGRDMYFFWSMIVWNYAEKKIQICTIKQVSIQDKLEALSFNDDWGNPQNYDVNIQRNIDKDKTTYEVIPSPPTDLTQEQAEAFTEKPINLKALFSGNDPFKVE